MVRQSSPAVGSIYTKAERLALVHQLAELALPVPHEMELESVVASPRHNKNMIKSVEGIYRNGKIDLAEPPGEAEGSRVIVTFVSSASVDLRQRGIDEIQAADLRRRLALFVDDWDRPEMNAYDELPSR